MSSLADLQWPPKVIKQWVAGRTVMTQALIDELREWADALDEGETKGTFRVVDSG